MWIIFRPSSVSTGLSSAFGPASSGATGDGSGSDRIGSGKTVEARIREIGGRMLRFVTSSTERRVLGTCGSISETLSTTGLAAGGASGSAGFGVGFFAVIGANADLVADLTASAGLAETLAAVTGKEPRCGGLLLPASAWTPSFTPETVSSLLVALGLATLLAGRGRDEGLAAPAFSALRPAVLATVDLLVVF